MELFSSSLFAFSASLDALIVGITYGIKRVHITLAQNIIVSLITLAGTAASISLGHWLAPLLPQKAATIAGSAILILLGTYYIVKYLWLTISSYLAKQQQKMGEMHKTSTENMIHKDTLSLHETILLGAALSINNMGIGIGASIAGLTLIPTAVITFLFSILLLFIGNSLGKIRLLRLADRFADPLSGLLLIGLGIYELLV